MKPVLVFIMVFLLSSCAAMMPTASPENAAKIRSIASEYTKGRPIKLRASRNSRVPIQRGQWVASLTTSKSDPNDLSLQIMKVAQLMGNTVVLETETYSSTNDATRQVMQQEVTNFPVKAKTAYSTDDAANLVQDMSFGGMKMMDDTGKVTKIPSLPFSVGQLSASLVRTNVSSGAIKKEPCRSTYFSSSTCYVMPFQTTVLWMTVTGTTFGHGDIPIIGYLKSDTDKHQVEVIGYGMKGAKIIIND